MSGPAPVLHVALPCRFGEHAPAVALVHCPKGDARLRDPLQALCADHVRNDDRGTVVAWLERDERSAGSDGDD